MCLLHRLNLPIRRRGALSVRAPTRRKRRRARSRMIDRLRAPHIEPLRRPTTRTKRTLLEVVRATRHRIRCRPGGALLVGNRSQIRLPGRMGPRNRRMAVSQRLTERTFLLLWRSSKMMSTKRHRPPGQPQRPSLTSLRNWSMSSRRHPRTIQD